MRKSKTNKTTLRIRNQSRQRAGQRVMQDRLVPKDVCEKVDLDRIVWDPEYRDEVLETMRANV